MLKKVRTRDFSALSGSEQPPEKAPVLLFFTGQGVQPVLLLFDVPELLLEHSPCFVVTLALHKQPVHLLDAVAVLLDLLQDCVRRRRIASQKEPDNRAAGAYPLLGPLRDLHGCVDLLRMLAEPWSVLPGKGLCSGECIGRQADPIPVLHGDLLPRLRHGLLAVPDHLLQFAAVLRVFPGPDAFAAGCIRHLLLLVLLHLLPGAISAVPCTLHGGTGRRGEEENEDEYCCTVLHVITDLWLYTGS